MIKVRNGVATREPVPMELRGMSQEMLADLSWTDPSLKLRDCAWWPEVDHREPLDELEYYGPEKLTPVPEQKVVVVTAHVMKPSKQDILDFNSTLMPVIDDAVEARIQKSTRFTEEYVYREAAAQAFKDAEYKGDPGDWVTRFAGNTGMSNKAAADLILHQAAGLREALKALANLRMDKYLIKSAPTVAAAREVQQSILNQIAAVIVP